MGNIQAMITLVIDVKPFTIQKVNLDECWRVFLWSKACHQFEYDRATTQHLQSVLVHSLSLHSEEPFRRFKRNATKFEWFPNSGKIGNCRSHSKIVFDRFVS